jgi:hypothetical protein
MKRIPITTLHELGHAYDFTNGRISASSEFQDSYNEEASRIPPEKRQQLIYFLQPEDGVNVPTNTPPHTPAAECFASLFARKYLKGNDKLLDALQTSFPKTFTLVQGLRP